MHALEWQEKRLNEIEKEIIMSADSARAKDELES